jgi:hypothetical protein
MNRQYGIKSNSVSSRDRSNWTTSSKYKAPTQPNNVRVDVNKDKLRIPGITNNPAYKEVGVPTGGPIPIAKPIKPSTTGPTISVEETNYDEPTVEEPTLTQNIKPNDDIVQESPPQENFREKPAEPPANRRRIIESSEEDTLSEPTDTSSESTGKSSNLRVQPGQLGESYPSKTYKDALMNKQTKYIEQISDLKNNHKNTQTFGDIDGHDLFYHPSISRDLTKEYINECRLSYIRPVEPGVVYIDDNDNQFNPAIRINLMGDRTIVTFRGTTTTNDFIADLYTGATVSVKLSNYFPFVKDEDDLLVHTGFLLSILGIYDKLSEVLVGRQDIEYTGHSYGSICCIYAYLRMLELNERPLHIYTFGSPRLFINDEDYPITRINDKLNIIRFFNENDIITYLPLAESRTNAGFMSGVVLALGYAVSQGQTSLISTLSVASAGIIGASLPFVNNFIHIGTGVKLHKEVGAIITGHIGFHYKHTSGRLPESESYIIVPEGIDIYRDIIGDNYFSSIMLSLLTTPLLPYVRIVLENNRFITLLERALLKPLTANQAQIGLMKRQRDRNIMSGVSDLQVSDKQVANNFIDLEMGLVTGSTQVVPYGQRSDMSESSYLTLNIVTSALDSMYEVSVEEFMVVNVPKTYKDLFVPTSDLTNRIIYVVTNSVKNNPIITNPTIPYARKVNYILPYILVSLNVLLYIGSNADQLRNLFSFKAEHGLDIYLETVSLLPETIAETKDTDHSVIIDNDIQLNKSTSKPSGSESTSKPNSSESTSTPPSESNDDDIMDYINSFDTEFGDKEGVVKGTSSVEVNADGTNEGQKSTLQVKSSGIVVHKHSPHSHTSNVVALEDEATKYTHTHSPHSHINSRTPHRHSPHSHNSGNFGGYYGEPENNEEDGNIYDDDEELKVYDEDEYNKLYNEDDNKENKQKVKLSSRVNPNKPSEPIDIPIDIPTPKKETLTHIRNGVYKSKDNSVYSSYVSNNKVMFRSHNVKIIGYYPYKNDSEINKLIVF